MASERYLIQLDNVKEIPGQITRGKQLLLRLPTSDEVHLQFVIASGKQPGPTVLITGNIHGDEITGVVVIHRLLEQLNLDTLRGKVVCVPSLNPTGLMAETRFPQFEAKDPNRTWPESKPKEEEEEKDEDKWAEFQKRVDDATGTQEAAFAEIAKIFIDKIKPDYHLDLHTFSILSHPFIFLDRVLYGPVNGSEAEGQKEAQRLYERTQEMVHALGISIFLERPAKGYVKEKLHRSTSGFTLNYMRIPSCTIEMGPMNAVRPDCRDGIIASIFNLLSWAKMVDAPLTSITHFPVIKTDKTLRYIEYPQAPVTGIVDYVKNALDAFKKGETIAVVRNMDGTVAQNIVAEMDGYVIGWWNGIAVYQRNVLGMVAVDDLDTPKVVPWSSIKKKD